MTIAIDGLNKKQLAALQKRAKNLGTTPQGYVKQLIADDLRLSDHARSHSLRELAAPIAQTFRNVSEAEIGELVESARTRNRRKLAR